MYNQIFNSFILNNNKQNNKKWIIYCYSKAQVKLFLYMQILLRICVPKYMQTHMHAQKCNVIFKHKNLYT